MTDEWEAREKSWQKEEAPILNEIAAAGLDVSSVWDLVNSKEHHPELVDILFRHLKMPYSDRVRSGIARALATPAAASHWKGLVHEYLNAPTGLGPIALGDTNEFQLGIKDSLACALAGAVNDDTMSELISLASDKSNGSSRLLLLRPLRRSRSAISKEAIEQLEKDPELNREIKSWRKR